MKVFFQMETSVRSLIDSPGMRDNTLMKMASNNSSEMQSQDIPLNPIGRFKREKTMETEDSQMNSPASQGIGLGKFSHLTTPPIEEVNQTKEQTYLDMTRETALQVQLDTQYSMTDEETLRQHQEIQVEMKRQPQQKKNLSRKDQHIVLLSNMRKQMYGEQPMFTPRNMKVVENHGYYVQNAVSRNGHNVPHAAFKAPGTPLMANPNLLRLSQQVLYQPEINYDLAPLEEIQDLRVTQREVKDDLIMESEGNVVTEMSQPVKCLVLSSFDASNTHEILQRNKVLSNRKKVVRVQKQKKQRPQTAKPIPATIMGQVRRDSLAKQRQMATSAFQSPKLSVMPLSSRRPTLAESLRPVTGTTRVPSTCRNEISNTLPYRRQQIRQNSAQIDRAKLPQNFSAQTTLRSRKQINEEKHKRIMDSQGIRHNAMANALKKTISNQRSFLQSQPTVLKTDMSKSRGRTSIVKVIDNKPVYMEKQYSLSKQSTSSIKKSPEHSPYLPRRSSLKHGSQYEIVNSKENSIFSDITAKSKTPTPYYKPEVVEFLKKFDFKKMIQDKHVPMDVRRREMILSQQNVTLGLSPLDKQPSVTFDQRSETLSPIHQMDEDQFKTTETSPTRADMIVMGTIGPNEALLKSNHREQIPTRAQKGNTELRNAVLKEEDTSFYSRRSRQIKLSTAIRIPNYSQTDHNVGRRRPTSSKRYMEREKKEQLIEGTLRPHSGVYNNAPFSPNLHYNNTLTKAVENMRQAQEQQAEFMQNLCSTIGDDKPKQQNIVFQTHDFRGTATRQSYERCQSRELTQADEVSRETGESHRVMQSITAMDMGGVANGAVSLNIGIEIQNTSPIAEKADQLSNDSLSKRKPIISRISESSHQRLKHSTASLDAKEPLDINYASDLFSTRRAPQDEQCASGSLTKIKSGQNEIQPASMSFLSVKSSYGDYDQVQLK